MVKIKEGIDKQRLRNFGFKNHGNSMMIKEIGALSIYIDMDTRKVTGCGFYPVGDRVVLDNIKGLIQRGLIETDVDTSKPYKYFEFHIS